MWSFDMRVTRRRFDAVESKSKADGEHSYSHLEAAGVKRIRVAAEMPAAFAVKPPDAPLARVPYPDARANGTAPTPRR